MTAVAAAMVLAAGRGERMRPLSDVLPKPALPLTDGPVIASALQLASDAGVNRIVVNTWHHIEFRNLDWGARTYDAYLNGGLMFPGAGFRGTSTLGNRIDMYHITVTGPSQAWYDEIIVKP